MTSRSVILRTAFWSGNLTYRKWRGMVRRGPQAHMRVFVQSFLHLPMDWYLGEIGEEMFISIWPEVRKEFSSESPFETEVRNAWDAIWGVMVAGDSQYPVRSEISRLPRMCRSVLKEVVCNPGISIYGLARSIRRDYSRVLKDVHRLVEMDEILSLPDPRSNRKAKQLLPARSINASLAGFTVP